MWSRNASSTTGRYVAFSSAIHRRSWFVGRMYLCYTFSAKVSYQFDTLGENGAIKGGSIALVLCLCSLNAALVRSQRGMDEPMKVYSLGYDFGNTEVGVVLLGKSDPVKASVPTAFCRIDADIMRNLGGVDLAAQKERTFADALKTLGVQLEKVDPTAYAFGDLALAQNVSVWSGRKDDKRYSSKYSVRGLCGLSGLMVPDAKYGLHVVTGLPAGLYMKQKNLREEIRAALNGSHTFSLDGGLTWRTVEVEVATVVMEGAGAMIAYGGKAANDRAVIDIGGGTTDLYVENKDGVPVTEYCRNTQLAVEAATEIMAASVERKYRTLTAGEARDVMHAHVAPVRTKKYPILPLYDKVIPAEDLAVFCEQAIEQVAEDLVSFVSSVWGSASRFNPILLIGGGYYYFYQALKKRIPHLTYPDDPVHANALGYANLAQRFLARKGRIGKGA